MEAANGPYCLTAQIAAEAGAKVIAFSRDSRYGSYNEVLELNQKIAQSLDHLLPIQYIEHLDEVDTTFDFICNTGFLRPIGPELLRKLRSQDGLVALMYEDWEFRPRDIDLDYCREHRIPIVATIEFNPFSDFSSYFKGMIRGFLEKYIQVNQKTYWLCDNPFKEHLPFIFDDAVNPTDWEQIPENANLILLLNQHETPCLNQTQVDTVIKKKLNLIHIWGNVENLEGFEFHPSNRPSQGHMSVIPSDYSVEAVACLQTTSLKACELYLENQTFEFEGTTLGKIL